VQVVVERSSQTAQVVLVFARDDRAAARALAEHLEARLPSRIHSVFSNLNTSVGNAILGPGWEHIAGAEAVRERFVDVDVYFPPGAFGQSHLELAERLVRRVVHLVPSGARVAELYAGVGAIGLSLLPRVASLAMNERDEASLAGLRLGLARRPPAEQARARVVPGDAAEQGEMLAGADFAIVDPPRRGVDPRLLDRLAKSDIRQLVYVSCALPSFLRDCEVLVGSGLQLRSLEPFMFFPHTEHLELLATFVSS